MATPNFVPQREIGFVKEGSVAGTGLNEPVSPSLYLAGLVAVLAAVYAVNFGLESASFGTFSIVGITLGFATSYWMRWRGTANRSLQIPVLLIVVLLIAGMAASERGMDWLWPSSVSGDRQKAGQVLLTWLLLLLSFLLNSNGAVLFCVVPSFAMLALVSQSNTDSEIQNSFLLFVTATTFLMVHDNFLRTRQFQAKGRTETQEKQLFGGQFQLAALCVMGALVFANVVAVPLKTIGMSVFSPSALSSLSSSTDKSNSMAASTLQVSENSSVELATGPVPVSDTVLMRVIAARGVNWRGTTFDLYTGTRFENSDTRRASIEPAETESTVQMKEAEYRGLGGNAPDRTLSGRLFVLPSSRLEIPSLEMENPHILTQTFRIMGGTFSQLYGATSVTRVLANVPHLDVQSAGGMLPGGALPQSFEYQVTSAVPDDDVAHLQAASSDIKDVPNAIQDRYLQLGKDNANLRRIANSVVRGQKNNHDKVRALVDYIGKTCKYNLQSPRAPRDRDLVEYFLMDSKMGYCDSFGASLVMLCRYAGIPARLVSGFLPGDFKEGAYVVKEKHKHIWTEVFFPKIGWVAFDATEEADDVSDYSSLSKKEMPGFIKWLMRDGMRLGVGIIICLLLIFIFKNEILNRIPAFNRKTVETATRPATNRQIIELYLESCRQLQRRGLVRTPALTPAEFAELVAQRSQGVAPDLASHWATLTTLFGQFRYGNDVASEADLQRARASAGALQTALRGLKRNALRPAPPAKMAKAKA